MTNTIPTSEYLQRQLVDMIELARTTGTNAVEFVQAQAPDVVRQIIVWEIWYNAILVTLFSVILILFFRWAFIAAKKVNNGEWEDGGIMISILCIGVCILMAVFLCYTVPALVKPIVAPKLFLIEYTANLFKK